MATTFKTFGAPEGGHPNYKTNNARVTGHATRHGKNVGAESCCYCGKGVKGRSKYTVFLTAMGEVVTTDVSALSDEEVWKLYPDYLGHYPLGSDCARKFALARIPVYAR